MKSAKEKIIVSPFNMGFIQDALSFFAWCEKNSISIQEVKDILTDEFKKKEVFGLFCKKCGIEFEKMDLPQDIYKFKTLMYCESCGHERIS